MMIDMFSFLMAQSDREWECVMGLSTVFMSPYLQCVSAGIFFFWEV